MPLADGLALIYRRNGPISSKKAPDFRNRPGLVPPLPLGVRDFIKFRLRLHPRKPEAARSEMAGGDGGHDWYGELAPKLATKVMSGGNIVTYGLSTIRSQKAIYLLFLVRGTNLPD